MVGKMTLDLNRGNENDNSFIFQLIKCALNSLPDLVYIMQACHHDFIYKYANQSGMTAMGTDSLIGKSLKAMVPPDRVDFLLHFYNRAAAYKRSVSFEEEVLISDTSIHYETVLTPVENNEETYIIASVRNVTERTKRANDLIRSNYVLEKNRQQLSSLIEHHADAVYMLDQDGYFLESNSATEKISGYQSFELLGTSALHLLPKQEIGRIQQLFRKAMNLGETLQFETTFIHKNGSTIYISVKTMPVKIDGEMIGAYHIVRDITAEKNTLSELQIVKRQLESFLNESTDAISLMNLNGEITYMNEAYSKMFGFSMQDVFTMKKPNVPEWLAEEANTIHDQVRRGKKLQNIHVKRQNKSGEILDVSITSFPVYDVEGNVIGITDICRDITELKKNERELANAKKELELIWNHSSEAMYLLAQDGTITKANAKFKEYFAEDDEEESLNSFNHLLDHQYHQTEELLARLRDGKLSLEFETKRKRKDGTIMDVLATYKPVDDKNLLAVVSYKDITSDQLAITELEESKEKYRNVVQHSPDASIIHDGRIITFINEAGIELVGASSAVQILGRPVMDFVHPDDHEKLLERMMAAAKQGKRSEFLEAVCYSIDKEKITVEIASAPLEYNGKSSVVVTIREIAKRKRAENSLKESEERFRIIAEHSRSVIKVLNLKGKVLYVSPSAEELLGYSPSNLIGGSFVEKIHREEIKMAENAIQSIIQTREAAEIEIRHIHQEGYSIWLSSYLTPILSSDGNVEKIIVISNDITEVKSKENKLKKLAYYDYLTGLPNRRLLKERLHQAIKTGNMTGLLALDCDKFKQINDTLGHDVGDEVIKEFANRIKTVLWKKDTLSRVGGDEFIIVLPELKDKDELNFICEKILYAAREPISIKGNIIQITASIGGSAYPSTNNMEALLKEADLNLYQSKKRGGNTFTN